MVEKLNKIDLCSYQIVLFVARKIWPLLKIKNSAILINSKWIKSLTNFFLTGNKFMPKFHLKQPVFTYSTCGLFTKHCERIQKFTETGNLRHLYRNEWDKSSFAHDAAFSDSKDLAKETISDKLLRDGVMKLLEIVTMMDIKEH